ncbi:uncharacterized protein [Aegilops tauschii subsp. strangulata]|nr:protein Rf1, mitochondrial-like [Aegilops tauschii subsp. strangulata]
MPCQHPPWPAPARPTTCELSRLTSAAARAELIPASAAAASPLPPRRPRAAVLLATPPSLHSTTPMSRIRLRRSRLFSSCATTPPPAGSWSPHAAFAAATERALAGKLSGEDAHHLFDELLRQATPVPERSLNGFLTALARAPDSSTFRNGPALARAPDSSTFRNGPALAIALFNRLCREEAGSRVAWPTVCTYNILMDCRCRTRRPDLGPAFLGRLLRTGLKTNQIVANTLLKCLCYAKRTDEAVNVLLHKMSELGCVPDAISYNTVLKRLCEDSRSQGALDLLRTVAKEGGVGSLDVVSHGTVIHGFFKEGETGKACNLFHEMTQQGIVPNVVTYNLIIDALCKARAMDKAELILRQMVDNGVRPDTVTCSSIMSSLCKHGRSKEAAEFFDSMTAKGLKADVFSYSVS